MAVRKIKLIVQYDGSGYRGWQVQPGEKTIQAALVEAVSSLIGRKTFVHGASRTDSGVHSLGQTALFETDSPIPTENFRDAINDRLPQDIVVTEATEASRKFDLISGPTNKLYRYTIYTGQLRPVMKINQCWHLPANLDIEAMQNAAKLIPGRKDFKSFASAKDKRETTVRTVFKCNVTAEENSVFIDVEGNGFLYNMVRNIVGTLVEIGIGRWEPDRITEIIEAKDRTAAGRLAPPNGLCLMWIKYD
jgi:tRNA pseudouridine38-40 synthase